MLVCVCAYMCSIHDMYVCLCVYVCFHVCPVGRPLLSLRQVKLHVCTTLVCTIYVMYMKMICVHDTYVFTCTCLCMCIFMYVCMHAVCVYSCMYACMHAFMYACITICVYNICMYIHTHIYNTYLHIHIQVTDN